MALVGVTGTLLAPVLSQRVVARIQSQQFERQERLAEAQWRRERQVAELDKRRECYVTANSGYRRYRLELMNFLWLIHKGEVTAQGRADLEEARGAMHVSFAEARMVAHPEGSFEELLAALPALGERWTQMRAAMRADLGVGGVVPVRGARQANGHAHGR